MSLISNCSQYVLACRSRYTFITFRHSNWHDRTTQAERNELIWSELLKQNYKTNRNKTSKDPFVSHRVRWGTKRVSGCGHQKRNSMFASITFNFCSWLSFWILLLSPLVFYGFTGLWMHRNIDCFFRSFWFTSEVLFWVSLSHWPFNTISWTELFTFWPVPFRSLYSGSGPRLSLSWNTAKTVKQNTPGLTWLKQAFLSLFRYSSFYWSAISHLKSADNKKGCLRRNNLSQSLSITTY